MISFSCFPASPFIRLSNSVRRLPYPFRAASLTSLRTRIVVWTREGRSSRVSRWNRLLDPLLAWPSNLPDRSRHETCTIKPRRSPRSRLFDNCDFCRLISEPSHWPDSFPFACVAELWCLCPYGVFGALRISIHLES